MPSLNINPVLLRFLKGLAAVCLAYAVNYLLSNLGLLGMNPEFVMLATPALLALEKWAQGWGGTLPPAPPAPPAAS